MQRISACLIVRDEEEHLPACLDSITPWVDEVCVLDTGSRDRTRELARERGARVEQQPWADDFAAARNASLALARGDWVLVVDADETLDPSTGERLRAAVRQPRSEAYLVDVTSLRDGGGSHTVGVPRLFRNLPGLRYRRPVHESLLESLFERGVIDLPPCGVRLVHTGYLTDVVLRREKRARNVAILRRWCREEPGDLYALYKLVQSLTEPGELSERRALARQAWTRSALLSEERRAELGFLPLVAYALARADLHSGSPSAALVTLEEALARTPGVSELRWLRGELAARLGRCAEAREHLRTALGSAPWTALYVGDPATRDLRPARSLAHLCLEEGDDAAALREARAGLARHPLDVELATLETRALLSGADSGAGLARLSKLLGAAPEDPHVRLLAGEVALWHGDTESARSLWEGARGTVETAASACAWLALADLLEGRLDRVGEHLTRLIADRLHTAATRVLLTAVAGFADAGLDRAWPAPAVLDQLVGLLRPLAEVPGQVALRAFAAGAPRLAPDLPGICTLVARGSSGRA